MIALQAVLLRIITAYTPLLVAAVGELVVERSAVLNLTLGVEGMMVRPLRLFVVLAARRPRFGFGDIDNPLSGVSVGTIVIPARALQNDGDQ